jgi:hypothetical protein
MRRIFIALIIISFLFSSSVGLAIFIQSDINEEDDDTIYGYFNGSDDNDIEEDYDYEDDFYSNKYTDDTDGDYVPDIYDDNPFNKNLEYQEYNWMYNNKEYSIIYGISKDRLEFMEDESDDARNYYDYKYGFKISIQYHTQYIKSSESIADLVEAINKVMPYGLDYYEKAEFYLKFVQYVIEYKTFEKHDPTKSPIHTLYDKEGDCEDSAMLLSSIYLHAGYDICYLHVTLVWDGIKHCTTSIKQTTPFDGFEYEIEDDIYYHCETTSTDWFIGEDAWMVIDDSICLTSNDLNG